MFCDPGDIWTSAINPFFISIVLLGYGTILTCGHLRLCIQLPVAPFDRITILNGRCVIFTWLQELLLYSALAWAPIFTCGIRVRSAWIQTFLTSSRSPIKMFVDCKLLDYDIYSCCSTSSFDARRYWYQTVLLQP